MDDLARRVDRLERECRRWRRGGLAALVALAGVGLMGAMREPGEVRAAKFTLVGANGTPRGEWGWDKSGAGFCLTGPDGVERLKLGVATGGEAGIYLKYLDDADLRASLTTEEGGIPSLVFYNFLTREAARYPAKGAVHRAFR